MIPPRIASVIALDDFGLEITDINGEKKIYDMKKNLKYSCFSKLNNINYFKKVKSVETTIEWPDGEDIDPNDLYENSVSC